MRRKTLIAITLIAIMLFNCIMPILTVGATTTVKLTFESDLYAALKAEFIKQELQVEYIDEQRAMIMDEGEVEKITKLSLANAELTDLTGLECFKNLTELDLSSNQLTKDSNLEVLNSFTLSTLDLSSNRIEDVSMLTGLDAIKTLYLHNQKFDIIEIIELDTSNTSDQITQVNFTLPKILSRAGFLETDWLIEESTGNARINWSRFDQKTIKVEVAQKTDSTYTPYKDMVTLKIYIDDTTNVLAKTEINMYFVIVDSDERGIHIPDKNMYKAIKAQLTKNQEINSDLISYKYASSAIRRNLYERTYDVPQVLVISINDIINKIPSLELARKQIERIDGIEKFVGLDTELDLSGNYIKSIDKLIELQENQIIEEAKLRERVSKQLALVSDTVGKISTINGSLETENKKLEEQEKALAELQENCVKLETELGNLRNEKDKLATEKDTLSSDVENLQETVETLNTNIEEINNTITTLNKELIDQNAEKEKLEQELATLQNELANLESDLESQKAEVQLKIDEKQKEIDAKNAEIERKQTDIANKQEEIRITNEELSDVKAEIDSKTTTIAIYDTQISDIEAIIIDTRTLMDAAIELQAIIDEINEDIETINSRLDTLAGDIESLSTAISEQKTDYEGQIADLQEQINDLKAEIEDLKNNSEPEPEPETGAGLTGAEAEAYVRSLFDELIHTDAEITAAINNVKSQASVNGEQEYRSAIETNTHDIYDTINTRVELAIEAILEPTAQLSGLLNTMGSSLDSTSSLAYYLDQAYDLAEELYYSVGNAIGQSSPTAQHYWTIREELAGLLIKAKNGYYKDLAEELWNQVKNGTLGVASATALSLTSGISNEALVSATDLQSTVDTLNAALDELDAEKERLQAEIDTLRAEISESDDSLEAQQAALEKKKETLQGELDTLNTQKTQLETDVSKLNQELDKLKEELKAVENTEEYKAIQEQIAAKEEEIKDKQTEISTFTDNITEIQKSMVDCEAEIAEYQKQLQEVQKQITEKQSKISELEKQLEAKEAEIVAKIAEIAAVIEQINAQNKVIADIEKTIEDLEKNKAILEEILYNQMEKLYNIYNRVDKLASVITPELKTATPEEFANLTYEEAKSMFEAQISKIASCEENLTPFEKAYFIEVYGIETITSKEVEKVIQNEDGTTTTVIEIEEEVIENPIAKHFEELAANIGEGNLSIFKSYLSGFRRDDIYFSMASYCYLTRLFTGLTNCLAREYANIEIDRLVFDGQSTTYLEEARDNYSGVIKTYKYNCSGQADTSSLFEYAARMANASGDINAYVNLYRLKSLNINENLIENLEKVALLVDLRKLYAYDNEIVDISNVDWASMTKLRILDIGFNGISDIIPLENLVNIEEIYSAENLISGKLEFDVSKFEKIKVLDLNRNQINDIEKLIKYLDYESRENGYSDIASFLRSGILDISFNHQELSMKVEKKFEVNESKKVDLPKIFRQIEQIDYANTSFAIDSLRGNVINDGEQVLLDTTREGNFNSTVTITNTGSTPSLGSGTTCIINYTVGDIVPTTVTITPATAEVIIGRKEQFTAEVTGEDLTYTGVIWEVEGATSPETEISEDGLLTVGIEETADTLIVRAISVYDETKSAEAEVTVIKKRVTSMEVVPNSTVIFKGESAEFTATVEGENLTEEEKLVDWQVMVDPIINEAGEEVMPTLAEGTTAAFENNTLILNIDRNETIETFKVVATSKFDNTKKAEAIITLDERIVSEVIITPVEASVEQRKTQEFTAEVNGKNLREEDKTVKYTVEGNTSEETTITEDGILTVGANENAENLIVKAISAYDETKYAEAQVTVIPRQVTVVRVTPNRATIFKGESAEFVATIEGENLLDEEKLVDWNVVVDPIINGFGEEVVPSIAEGTKVEIEDNKLVLTIGANEEVENFTVVATSKFDNTKVAEAKVTIDERIVSEVIVTPEEASVAKGRTLEFTTRVTGEKLREEDKAVIYTVEGNISEGTTISEDGVLTVAEDETATTLKVKVTSKRDNTKYTEIIVTVTKRLPEVPLGYDVDEEYVLGVATKTPVSEFKTKLTDDYTVIVKKDGVEVNSGYMETGMYVEIQDEEGNTVRESNGHLLAYQVIVKGDINGDGVADSLDSNLIKAYRNEIVRLSASQVEAADINNDGSINIFDSKLLLYHRAEVYGYNLDYVK